MRILGPVAVTAALRPYISAHNISNKNSGYGDAKRYQ